MRVSCDLPNDQRVFPVLPQANQAVGRVDWPWVVLEFENVCDRRGPNQVGELMVAGGRPESFCDCNAIISRI